MRAFAIVVAAGLASYALRVSMVVLVARGALPSLLERAAGYAVPTAFAALATGSLLSAAAGPAALAPISAVTAAALAVRRTGSPHVALVAGLPVLWATSALLPG